VPEFGVMKNFLPPAEYRRDYVTEKFPDNSYLESAPRLSVGGEPAFLPDRLRDSKYQYNKPNKPGELSHAGDPNPRSAIIVPDLTNPNDKNDKFSPRVRLVVGLANDRHKENSGFTMPEWSSIVARLDAMNGRGGHSLNLDGGGSSTIGVVSRQGKKLFSVSQDPKGREIANYIVFHRRY